MKVREVLRKLKEDGWYLIPSSGTSHKQFKHPVKKGRVTVAGKTNKDIPVGTLKSIYKQADWT